MSKSCPRITWVAALSRQGTGSVSFAGYHPSSPAASARMRSNRSRGGRAQNLLQTELRRRGIRFRSNVATLPGKPDVVLSSGRVCIFCDGDFWHGRCWRTLRRQLERRANPGYWTAKIASNRRRDRRVSGSLRRSGWQVIRVWETDVLAEPGTYDRQGGYPRRP